MAATSARPESWWRAQEPATAFYPPDELHADWTAETWFIWGYPTIEALSGVPRNGYCCAFPTCLDALYFLRWPLLAEEEAFGVEHADLNSFIDYTDDTISEWANWLDNAITYTREHGQPATASLLDQDMTIGQWEILRIESLPHCISSHGDAAWWQQHFPEGPIEHHDSGNVRLTIDFLAWLKEMLGENPEFLDEYR